MRVIVRPARFPTQRVGFRADPLITPRTDEAAE
jgi:hypothetical protein